MQEGASCKPNISSAGRKQRRMFGYICIAFAAVFLLGMIIIHAAWWTRAIVFLPVAMAGTGFLQASRNTCVARASEGTFENEDFSKTPMAADDVRASRKVATTIYRDSILLGLAVALIAAATSWVR